MAPPELPGGLELVRTPQRAPSEAQTPRKAQRMLLRGRSRTKALLFESGAGKTTALKMLSFRNNQPGTVTGKLLVNGRELTSSSDRAAFSRKVRSETLHYCTTVLLYYCTTRSYCTTLLWY